MLKRLFEQTKDWWKERKEDKQLLKAVKANLHSWISIWMEKNCKGQKILALGAISMAYPKEWFYTQTVVDDKTIDEVLSELPKLEKNLMSQINEYDNNRRIDDLYGYHD